jgi:fibronectin-binding autotransporter adhesin
MISPFLQKSVFEGRPLAGAGCLIEFGSGALHRVRARKSSRETRVERRGLGFFDWLATCFNLSMLFPRLSFGLRLAVLAPGLLTFAFSLQVRAADVVWVGDDNDSNGAWSRTGNWTNNTAPNFQTNNRIVFQNNLTSTNMLYDLSGWVNASDIIWDTTFNVSRTLNSTAGGIDFATRVENLSSNTQTVAMNLSGGKFGATNIELNPVNGDLVINGPFFNDNSLSYNIWGNTGRTLTLNSTLGPNATQSGVAFTIQRNTTVVLNTNQLWQGTTTLNGGNLRVGASGLLGNGAYSGAIVMNSFNGTNAALVFSNSANQTLSGAISGTGSFTMAGTGTTTLTGVNTYSGGTVVSQGALIGGASTSFGSGSIVLGDGTTGTNNIVLVMNSSGSTTIANAITVANLGTGLVSIGGTNTGSGNYNQWSGLLTLNRNVQLFASDTSTRSTFDGQITGSGGITITQGRVTLGNTNNNFTGSVLVNNGATLQLGVANGINELIPNSSAVTVNGSLNFASGGGTETIGSLAGSGTVSSVVGGNYSLVIGGSDSTTFSGVINNGSGNVSLTKSGTGALTLSGTSTYSGTTTISNGTLQVAGLLGGGNYGAAISNNASLAFSNSAGQTLSGVISGSGTLTKAGLGTLTLSQANSYSGGTMISQGALVGGASTSFGSGSIVLGDGNTGTNGIVLMADTTENTTIANAITVANLGTGLVSIGGTNTGSGRFNAWTGTLTLNRNVQVFNDTPHADGRTAFIGQITGSGGITVTQGRGRVTLQNTNNNFTGPVVVNSGATLQLDVANGINELIPNSSAVTVNGSLNFASGGGTETIGSLAGSGTVSSVVGGNYSLVIGGSDSTTFSGAINNGSGNVSLTKSGAGTLTLSGTNTYTGGTTVSAGTLQVGNGGTTGTLGSGNVTNNASLAFNRSDNITASNTISGSGQLVQAGAGTTTLSGANTYTGGTTINAGMLALVAANRLADAGAVTVNAGTFNLGGFSDTVGTVTLSGGAITNGTLTGSSYDVRSGSVAAVLAGNGALTKSGAGTVSLTGANTYTGTTTVSVGTLAINGDSRGATGSVTVSSGGTLAGSGTVGGATTIQSGAIHAPGNSPGLQTFNNGLTYNTGSTFQWELIGNTSDGRGANYDGVNVTGGTLSIGTGVTSSLVFNTSSSTVSWNDVFWNENRNWLVFDNANSPTLDSTSVFDTINLSADSLGKTLTSDRPNAFFGWNRQGSDVYLTYTAVPEPSTYALLALATAALGAHAWRRRRRAMGR